MARTMTKLLILGAVLVLPAVLFGAIWFWWSASDVPSKIVDFRPTTIQARATTGFFYSIGDQLKFGDEISPQSPTLAVMPGRVGYFLVSPNEDRIAVVSRGKLLVVSRIIPVTIRTLVSTDSIFREQKPLGRQFFRDFEMQWSRDSKVLFIVKDEFYETKGAQLFSDEAELWRYDWDTDHLEMVLKRFPAGDFFLGQKAGIYFSAATQRGDVQLRYFDGAHTHDVGAPNASDIPAEQLNPNFHDSPFSSFDNFRWGVGRHGPKQLTSVVNETNGLEELRSGSTTYLVFTRGVGFKGPYYCDQADQGDSLPGDRYYLFSVYCDNYKGQILLDRRTGQYEQLPKDSQVYLTFNSESYLHYRITASGIEAE